VDRAQIRRVVAVEDADDAHTLRLPRRHLRLDLAQRRLVRERRPRGREQRALRLVVATVAAEDGERAPELVDPLDELRPGQPRLAQEGDGRRSLSQLIHAGTPRSSNVCS
jgi:hypothetical protein